MFMKKLQPFLSLTEVIKPKPDRKRRQNERKSFGICLSGVSSLYVSFPGNCFVLAV
jgi:hypothetical protein